MPFERPELPPRRIAVIGGGISGMAAAHLLSSDHAVVLFEAEGRLGGHARTVIAGKRKDQPVDTGFIVFNKVNYPNLVRLFDDLDVPVTESDMSFGASIGGGRFEYALKTLDSVFATRSMMLNPRYLRMLRDILHFNAKGVAVSRDPSMTIGDMLAELRTGDWFRDYYITPLSGAIWSTPVQGILDFPAKAMVDFFQNHALMSLSGQHQWYTVKGGSVEYVRRLHAAMDRAGVDIRLSAPVAAVRRLGAGVMVRPVGGEWELFDEVVFATHSDQALRMLEDADAEEQGALSKIRYQPNEAVLHADVSLMPKRRKVWSSWVYVEPADCPRPERIDLTYWMNSLQPIPQDDPLFVTLNSNRPIRDDLIHDVVTFHHPVYDLAAEQGRQVIRARNGARNTWFCGAWMKNGFHEDGFASAVDVVDGIRARPLVQVAAE
ncbi:cyclopropane-fatty-acyl-phospholipid synthase [Aliigemmobacter aestuarii]|uniref:Cyclopropane-fatty-acyl-phospholipid synthase n=1 Tax=Aliigemmobacter aestuarii TaxID=1445661 RepID=A0A4S3MNP1_9RHOB|nr:FAD-dependent oxidoreductase [Gemmobacter aestuarii]THD83644.1 cyclopropane-fatty-acyl-phospholipid synthase [Gemmobacter aestuarii]